MNVHDFCRAKLAAVMVDVRKRFTPEEIKAAWVYNTGRSKGNPQWEFHGPRNWWDYNLQGADCARSARAEGWQRFMDRMDEQAAELKEQP